MSSVQKSVDESINIKTRVNERSDTVKYIIKQTKRDII